MRRAGVALGVVACIVVACAYGLSLEAVELAAFAAILVAAAIVDAETRRIPNAFVLAACAVRFLYIGMIWLLGGGDAASLLAESLVGALAIGAGLLAFTIIADRIFGGRNMGGGDIKLFSAVGLYFGLQVGLAVLAGACVLGAAMAMLSGKKATAEPIDEGGAAAGRTFAFGPAIAVSAIVAMLVTSPFAPFSLF